MTIGFNSIPSNINTPGVYVEFDGSRAVKGLAARPNDVLIIGQKLAAGTATAEVPVLVSSTDEASGLFGNESNAHELVRAYKQVDPFAPLWVIPYIDHASGVAAAGSFIWTGTATAAGTIVFYIGGRRVEVPVASGDTAANVETNALAVFATVAGTLPVTVAGDAAAGLDVTARHAGTIGNGILLGVCLQPGEKIPAGLAVVVTQMSAGATDTALTGVVTAMGEDQYATVVCGNNAATEVARIVTELERRWGPMAQIEGSLFVGKQETRAALTTYGNGFNSGMLVAVGAEKSAAIALPWEVAAQAAAITNLQNQVNPARSSQNTSFVGISAAHRGSRFTRAERDILLSDGIATVKAGSDGRLLVERFVTTYQTNGLSLPDTALKDHSTVRVVAALRYTWRARVASKFPNWLLAADGNEISGQPIATPKILKDEAIAWFGDTCEAAWTQNPDLFKKSVLVELDPSDPNRANMILPPDIMRNLLVLATKMAYA